MWLTGLLNVGDVIKEIDGQEVSDPDVLTEMMRKAKGSITFKIIPSYVGQSSRAHVRHLAALCIRAHGLM